MKDLTTGSIAQHILSMAGTMVVGMVTQTLYVLVDLYFVSRTGSAATAGLNAAGASTYVNAALVQVLGVGTMIAVAHATGRRDQVEANLMFNQSFALSVLLGLIVGLAFAKLSGQYLAHVAADAASAQAGAVFITWIAPALALGYPSSAIGASWRGSGVVRPGVVIGIVTVLLNALLAPILISGWGTGVALGVKGAGLASTLSAIVGMAVLLFWFVRGQHYLSFRARLMFPRPRQWWRILRVGLPAGGELVLAFFSTTLLFYAIRHFGASVQAGVGIGMRVTNGILLPVMAIAASTGPIAGQNFGARKMLRVKETFRKAVWLGTAPMVVVTILVHWRPEWLVGTFSSDALALNTAAMFLSILSWTFVLEGLLLTSSGIFRALGNAMPSLLCYVVRFVLFFFPALWLTTRHGFRLQQLFYVSNAAVVAQTALSLWLLRVEFKRKLGTSATGMPASLGVGPHLTRGGAEA